MVENKNKLEVVYSRLLRSSSILNKFADVPGNVVKGQLVENCSTCTYYVFIGDWVSLYICHLNMLLYQIAVRIHNSKTHFAYFMCVSK